MFQQAHFSWRTCIIVVLALLALGVMTEQAYAFEIDDFPQDISLLVWPDFAPTNPVTGTVTSGGFGTTVTLTATLESGSGIFVSQINNGEFSQVVMSAGETGKSELMWSGSNIDIDLTDSGLSTHFLITVTEAVANSSLAITVYDITGTSTTASPSVITSRIITPTLLLLDFGDFGTFDFNHVAAVKLTVQGGEGEIAIDTFSTGAEPPPTAVTGLALRGTGNKLSLFIGPTIATMVSMGWSKRRKSR